MKHYSTVKILCWATLASSKRKIIECKKNYLHQQSLDYLVSNGKTSSYPSNFWKFVMPYWRVWMITLIFGRGSTVLNEKSLVLDILTMWATHPNSMPQIFKHSTNIWARQINCLLTDQMTPMSQYSPYFFQRRLCRSMAGFSLSIVPCIHSPLFRMDYLLITSDTNFFLIISRSTSNFEII